MRKGPFGALPHYGFMSNLDRLTSDGEFEPARIQLGYLLDAYVHYLRSMFGSWTNWVARAGRPEPSLFLSDKEISNLLGSLPGVRGDRARAVLFWACVNTPTWKNGVIVTKQGNTVRQNTFNAEIVGWHVLAVQELFKHPEYW